MKIMQGEALQEIKDNMMSQSLRSSLLAWPALEEHPVENVLVSEAAAHKALICFSFCTHGILDRSMRDQTNSLAALLKVHVLRRGITKPIAVFNPGRWSRSAG